MKRMIKRFAFLAALVALFGMLTVTAYAEENDPVDMSLVFSSETRLDVYVDNEWNASLSDRYGFGDTATITAPDVSGKTFSHWEADGSTISYANPLKLTMNAHTTLYAVYASAAPTTNPAAGFTSITRTNDGSKISFQAIASGDTAGIVYSTTTTGEELKIGGTGVTNVAAEKITDSTTTMPKSVLDNNNCWMLQITPDSADTVYHARAYVTSGGTATYGDVKDVKLSGLKNGISQVANLDGNDNLADLTQNMCTVTFDANGGEGTMLPQGMVKNTATPLNANTYTRSGYTFNGWSTSATGSVAYSDGQTVTLSGDTTLYAQWRSNSSSTSGGGIPTPTTGGITIPVSGEGKDAETVNVTVQVSGNTATVTSADVDKVLEAKDVGNVTVDVSSLSSLNSSVDEVVLPAALVEKVAAAVADQTKDASGLEIKLPTGTVTLDATAVAAIAAQSNGKDVTLHLDKVSVTTLTTAQQTTIKDMNVLVVLDAYMTVDGQRITEFNGGTATFSVPVTLAQGQVAAGVAAYFVAEDGDKTEIPCTYDGKNAVGTVSHFSNYVVAYDAQSAKTVEDTVNALDALPAAADVKLEDKETIEKARAAYEALTDEQKAKVSPETLKKLTDAEAALKAKESGEPQPEPTPENPTYDSLTDTQKKTAEKLVNALKVNAETAAQMVLASEKLGVSTDTLKLSEAAILALKDDSDPKGSDFGKLTSRATKRTNNAITLQWKKQKKADGYMVFGNVCGKKYKLLKTITKNSTTSFTQKKLKKGKNYKYLVVAYKNVNGQKMPIAAAMVVHTNTKGGKVTVAKSLTVKQGKKVVSKLTVKKGKSVTVKVTENKEEKKLKIKTHRKVKFESSNPKVATVNAKGKITGKGKGKTTIYAYAQNGIYKTVKVTVK